MTNVIFVEENDVSVVPVDAKVEVNVCENVAEVLVGTTGPQGPRGTQVLSGTTNPSPVIGLIGDQYINTNTGYLFGPKTESGWGSGVVLGSGLGLDDVAYTHYQTVASTTWGILQINHNLQFIPNVTVVDLSGNVIEGDCQYISGNIVITFSQAIAGLAYLS